MGSRYDLVLEGHRRLDEKSQYLSALFHSSDLRELAAEWGVRRLIWQKFWDRLFEEPQYSHPRWKRGMEPPNPHRPPAGTPQFLDPASLLWSHRRGWAKAAPPMVEEFDGSYWARHQENLTVMRVVGAESYQAALDMAGPNSPFGEELSELQTVLSRELAGVDVFWNGAVEDTPTSKDPEGAWYRKLRHNSSPSGWGVLRVYSFPFTAIFRYDDCDEQLVLSAVPLVNRVRRFPKQGIEQLREFVRLNTDPAVMELRELRMKMRAMDEQVVTARVRHGSRGEVRGTFHLHQEWSGGESWKNPFTNEIMSVAPGFRWDITTMPRQERQGARCVALVCGEPGLQVHPDNFARRPGAAHDEDDDLDNAPRPLSKPAMGLGGDAFTGDDAALDELVNWPGNVDPELLEYVRNLAQAYRSVLADSFDWKRGTVTYEFHVKVYGNDLLTREQLTAHLEEVEGPESLLTRDLVHGTAKRTYSHLLQDLYHRLAFFDGSLRAVCWYMFWHGVALNNRARNYELMDRAVQKKLDPSEPGAPVTRVMPRPELETLLAKLGVYHADGSRAVSDQLLDNLYEKMAEVEVLTLKQFSKKWVRNVTDAKRVVGRTEEQAALAEERARSTAKEKAAVSDARGPAGVSDTDDGPVGRVCSREGGCVVS